MQIQARAALLTLCSVFGTSIVFAADTTVEMAWNADTGTLADEQAAKDRIKAFDLTGDLILNFTGNGVPADIAATLTVGRRTHKISAVGDKKEITLANNLFDKQSPFGLALTAASTQKQYLAVTGNVTNARAGDGLACAEERRKAVLFPVYYDSRGWVDGQKIKGARHNNRVDLRFGPDGRRLSSLPEHIDANDEIVVHVVAPADELSKFDVEVVSGEYAPVYLNIHRGTEQVPIGVQQATGLAPRPCEWREFNLGRFTSGTVVFRIVNSDAPDNGRPQMLRINPLYHGTVRLGIVRSELDEPTYGLLVPAGGSTQEIYVSDEGDRSASYVIEYVPFVLTKRRWAGRDLLKPPRGWDRVNFPVIGVALDAPDENIFVGLDLELTRGVALTGGVHYGKRLDLADGYLVGSPFAGVASEIPSVNRWDTEIYYGVSLDLMIVANAFRGVLSGGK